MSKNKFRATASFNKQKIEVGYYNTKAEVTAARNAARLALQKWEDLHPEEEKEEKKPEKRKLPSANTLVHFIHQGTYDAVIEEIADAALGRYKLTKRHDHIKGRFPTSQKAKSVYGLNRTKPQALSEHL